MSGEGLLKTVKYKKDSYITVEGKLIEDRFFIIQEGKVQLSRSVEQSIVLGSGELFGFVSALSGHSCVETAIAITDVTLYTCQQKQYGDFIKMNPAIAVNLIQQFSRRLRQLDEAFSQKTLEKVGANDPSHLFQVAEYYAAQRRFTHAFYAYRQYVKHCPTGEYLNEAQKQMMEIAPHTELLKPVRDEGETKWKYPKDCIFFAEGEPGNELYIIQKGSVKISKIMNNQEVLLAVLTPGDIFGEMALLEDKPRAASAVSNEDSVVLSVNRTNFTVMISTQPQVIAKLTGMLAERLWLIYKQLANTLIDNPLGRIYDVLLIQLEKNRVSLNTNQTYVCNFGAKELAGMAGLTPEEGEPLIKKILIGKRISLTNDRIFVLDASDVVRQAEYYRRLNRISIRREAHAE